MFAMRPATGDDTNYQPRQDTKAARIPLAARAARRGLRDQVSPSSLTFCG
jgi:hypothetical protein